MGGIGSGRGPFAETPMVERCLHLDVNEFTEIVEEEDVVGRLEWHDGKHQIHYQLRASDESGGRELLLFYETKRSGESKEYDYTIPITFTDCNFGGERPWWRCPHCRSRVGKLYLPPTGERFKCRECYDLGYRSSRESGRPLMQATRRYQRIQKKLDQKPTHPNSIEGSRPDRPKGMHQETYEELLDDLRAAEHEYTDVWMTQLRAMTGAEPHEGPEEVALQQMQ